MTVKFIQMSQEPWDIFLLHFYRWDTEPHQDQIATTDSVVSNLPCLFFAGGTPPPHICLCLSGSQAPRPSCISYWKPHIFSLTARQQSRGCPVPSSRGKCSGQRAADAQSQGHVPLKCWAGEKTLFPCCLWPGRMWLNVEGSVTGGCGRQSWQMKGHCRGWPWHFVLTFYIICLWIWDFLGGWGVGDKLVWISSSKVRVKLRNRLTVFRGEVAHLARTRAWMGGSWYSRLVLWVEVMFS
jgi:hypothetical protein